MATKKKLLQAAAGQAGATSGVLDNVSIPAYGFFSVVAQDNNAKGVFFKSDGTKMYVIGSIGDAVYEYTLSTAWDVYTASYVQSYSVATQEASPEDVFFKSDGTKMYVLGGDGVDVSEYTLSTAWDISTASYNQNFSVSAQEGEPQGFFFKPDGTKMYVTGRTGDDVNEYNLSTAWDVSTASYNQNFSVSSQHTAPTGVFFKPDGAKMYVTGTLQDTVSEYTLSTAWDISTASHAQSLDIINEEASPQGVFFKPDGAKMYVVGTISDGVLEYSLGTAWDVSTASWDEPASSFLSVKTQDGTPRGVFFKPDGTKMYFVGATQDRVNEYTLSTAWDISTASYIQNFSVNSQDTAPEDIFFKSDGTKMYLIGRTGDAIYEYTLSTAWDISTASYIQNFSVATEEIFPTGLFFKSDGTKVYVTGDSGDDINEYSLSTAWDISTASYDQNFSVATEDVSPTGVFFKDDGTKMLVAGNDGDAIYEYTLSTEWDVSTASYDQNFSLIPDGLSSPQGVFLKPDNTKMYIIDISRDAVFAYSLV